MKLKLKYFGCQIRKEDLLEKFLILGKIDEKKCPHLSAKIWPL